MFRNKILRGIICKMIDQISELNLFLIRFWLLFNPRNKVSISVFYFKQYFAFSSATSILTVNIKVILRN